MTPTDDAQPPLTPLSRFLGVLGFLTRLVPGRLLPEADMRRAMFHLPLCGLALGLAVAAPLAALHAAGPLAGKPLAHAWLAVLLSAWLTRGLHLDGLADICDGAASHVEPERFWTIVKDSRVGVFGAAGVGLYLLGQVALLAEALRGRDPLLAAAAIAWVLLFGRCCGVVFGFLHRAGLRPGLGGLFLAGADKTAVIWAAALALGTGLQLGFSTTAGVVLAGAVLAAWLLLAPLSRLGRAVGGINGDFLGASILLGETAAALSLALLL